MIPQVLPPRVPSLLEQLAEEEHDGVRSRAVEDLLEKGLRFDDVVEKLERNLEHERARADDLQRQMKELQQREEDVGEIVEYVQEERSAEQRWRQAGLVTRAKWTVFGMDVDDDSADR